MSEPEAVAVHLKDMDVMSEPIEKRAREPLGSEYGCPLVKWQVAGNDGRATFVSLTEDLKK